MRKRLAVDTARVPRDEPGRVDGALCIWICIWNESRERYIDPETIPQDSRREIPDKLIGAAT